MAGCSPGRGSGCAAASRLAVVCAAAIAHLGSGDDAVLEYVPRNYSGVGNNIEFPLLGSTGTTQIRAIAGAEFEADGFTAPGDDRPTAREVMTDVFLTSTAGLSSKSALFVAWGQLVTFDLALTQDNDTEPLPVPCNFADDEEGTDIWCPLGDDSDEISFFRSDAAVDADGVRSPINYATSYLDLDFVYGRTAEEAGVLRTLEGGLMNVTASGVPYQNADGTWLIADQRTAAYPVTFALHIVLLLEHNRCCVEVAPGAGFEGDEDIYQVCRGWTIATFQHVTQNDFLIRLLGVTYEDIGIEEDHDDDGDDDVDIEDLTEDLTSANGGRRSRRRSRRRLDDKYNDTVNAAADVFVVTAGGAALESALPGTVRIVSDGFVSVDDDYMELADASADLAGLFARNDVANIIRGAVLSPALDVDPYYYPIVSNRSPLFKLPVDAVQRGRDHGLPTYNDAREAYGLDPAADFSDVTTDADLADRLSTAYGGDIDNLDAFTGALAEGSQASTGGVFGDLLFAAWADQFYRSITGDRFYHSHDRDMEDVSNTTLSDLVASVTSASDLPLSVFQTATITVCDGQCSGDADGVAVLSDTFEISWEEVADDQIEITLSSSDIEDSGWMGIGWGGLTMATAQDFVICEVLDDSTGACSDHAPTTVREVPPLDDAGTTSLNVTVVSVEGGWTSVTFRRDRGAFDLQDFDLGSDIDDGSDTLVIYAYREGDGIGQHPNANRGAATLNFATGTVDVVCDGNDFLLVHGSLMLIAWMVLIPLGIYYVRYRKGESVRWCSFDFEWFEAHQELMIIASEAVLPLAITAVFASGGDHTTSHAHWGFYMIAAVALQVISGFIRVKGLEAAQANFSFFHRFNKHFHIYSGRFAFLAGVVQCYRGLELVSGEDNLILSAGDGLDLELSNYDHLKDVVFPIWFLCIAGLFVVLETRKQYRRYFRKGSAKLCGLVEVVNSKYEREAEGEDEDDVEDRLVPRTEDLPLYTMAEFNEKVLHGQSWVLVDNAILDVSEFSHRHPGGARLVLNALGTDVTQELLGEDLSVGHAMSFAPHRHPESAWGIVRSLVVGYIDEEEEEEEEEPKIMEAPGGVGGRTHPPARDKNRAFRIAGKAVLMTVKAGRDVGNNNNNSNDAMDMSKFNKARKSHDLAVIPTIPPAPAAGSGTSASVHTQSKPTVVSPGPASRQVKRAWSSKKLLERYHVCPLLFREKMGSESPVGRGQLPTKRPVYRYVFSCPGQAQALVGAITGVCYFNMRGQAPRKGVIQRSYNAYAVRVQESGNGGARGGKKGAGIPKVVPANETTNGELCIEMRIRIYHDGAMSQLLEQLSKAKDNPAVQLQGPFIITQLVPPPAHRNVIMIAAGTGINPMVQQIRDYLAFPRVSTISSRSRLSLVWQSTSEAELYGTEEITALQAKSKGLLEVTVLVSGDQRRRNIPGAAFKRKVMAKARAMVSPMMSSVNSSSSLTATHGRISRGSLDLNASGSASAFTSSRSNDADTRSSKQPRPRTIKEHQQHQHQRSGGGASSDNVQASKFGASPTQFPTPLLGRTKESDSPSRKPRTTAAVPVPHFRRDPSETLSEAGGGLNRGKVTREVLDKAFGRSLLKIIEDYKGERLTASSRGSREEKRDEDHSMRNIDVLAGTDTVAGKLQVVLSGPSGFVFYVENILAEMGVPSSAIVLLD